MAIIESGLICGMGESYGDGCVVHINRQGQRLLPQCHKYADYYAFAFFTAAQRFR